MKTTFAAALALALSGSACIPNTVGLGCKSNADCSNTYTCFTQLSGGYCSRGCDVEGSQADCPAQTVCAPVATGVQACADICTDDAQCTAGLKCGAVNGFAQKVCRKP